MLVKHLTEEEGFLYLKQLFPRIKESKIKQVGPQLHQVLKDEMCPTKLNEQELIARSYFKDLCTGFFGCRKSPNYTEMISRLLHIYHAIGARM